jgi:3-dehydro-L-gulonate 2-dehydrogenase
VQHDTVDVEDGMMRISADDMKRVFVSVLEKNGLSESDAKESAELFVENSIDGVYSHGVNRFSRVVAYLRKGLIDPKANILVEGRFGAMERWNGNLGMGNLIARRAMVRAIALAKGQGLGCVAVRNTNHWMRGGAYGWQAADAGCIGICWTNTMPNMPAWGGKDTRIGNNPFVMAIPRSNGEHIVVDGAMSQYSYGKLEETEMKGKRLPFPGGFDEEGNLTTDPAAIEKTSRMLPIGYWKGSAMSIALDAMAAMLSGGNTVSDVGKQGKDEYGVSQVFLAIDPTKFSSVERNDAVVDRIVSDLGLSSLVDEKHPVRYPGEQTMVVRKENLAKGIPVEERVWKTVMALTKE